LTKEGFVNAQANLKVEFQKDKKLSAICTAAQNQAEATEAARALAPKLARQLADAGMFSMFVPEAVGGAQLTPLQGNARLQVLAMHDAASAWVSMIGATAALGAAFIKPEISGPMFADPSRITCGIFAPNGRALQDGDDYIVSGRWAWASGSANADYIGLGCMAQASEDAKPSVRLLMIPREEIIFHDTWHTMGLCGTSSGDVEVDQVRVPVAHSYSIATDTPWIEDPLYKMPYFGFLATGVGAVALGNARAALDDFLHLAMAKTPMGNKRTLAERSGVQAAVAEAEALWRSADAFYWQTLREIWQAVEGGQAISPEQCADLRLISTHAVRTCVQVVRQVHDLAGGTSVYKTSAIQRRLRDSETMTQHMIANAATYEMIGRVKLGGYNKSMQL
jgi:alkylation response protein AidB-like acyl-CoA dehydrogenase